jgi:hypothetical protein
MALQKRMILFHSERRCCMMSCPAPITANFSHCWNQCVLFVGEIDFVWHMTMCAQYKLLQRQKSEVRRTLNNHFTGYAASSYTYVLNRLALLLVGSETIADLICNTAFVRPTASLTPTLGPYRRAHHQVFRASTTTASKPTVSQRPSPVFQAVALRPSRSYHRIHHACTLGKSKRASPAYNHVPPRETAWRLCMII